ncbi:MAG: hypothetical protein GPJ54_07730 [Candidatus Heimdallarchaeota archaeon]|nr:hypothetical protein [Candidatus Heimdallarchaeota archaeon]
MSDIHDIFKIAIFSPSMETYKLINQEDSIFGYEFSKSYTKTQGAAFGFSHFNLKDQRLTAQFWALDGSKQWVSVRNLYLKKTSGMILLLDSKQKGWEESANRFIVEFVAVNRFSVPILIVTNAQNQKLMNQITKYKKSIERWTGFGVPIINLNAKEKFDEVLIDFMTNVKNWRAKTVVIQTLRLYFSFDVITKSQRSVNSILNQLRQIYISRYIRFVDDNYLRSIIIDAAVKAGFEVTDTEITYKRKMGEDPYDLVRVEDIPKKPKITKM